MAGRPWKIAAAAGGVLAVYDDELRAMRMPVLRGEPLEGMLEFDIRSSECAHSALALVRAAIGIERAGWKDGTFTAPTSTAPGLDPSAGSAPIHYAVQVEGRGYRLWSVGPNGKDDGGVAPKSQMCTPYVSGADDVVLERSAPHRP